MKLCVDDVHILYLSFHFSTPEPERNTSLPLAVAQMPFTARQGTRSQEAQGATFTA
jgi:hypothetical protein